MEFSNNIGKLQRLMAASSAGISRRKAIMDTLILKANDRIIDIGCGGGYLVELLASSVGPKGRVYGLDPSEEQISQARLRCGNIENVSLLHSFADQIDLEDNSCDVVTSTQTLEYIPDVDAALEESTRVLKTNGEFANISILWEHFRFYGAEKKLNEEINEAFKAHCSHQMLPMEFPGKLAKLGYENIKHKSLSFLITHRDQNSPALYTEETMAVFALSQGISETNVRDWREQLADAEVEGRFGFTSYPVLTYGYLR